MKIHLHTPSFFPALVGMTYATHEHAQLLTSLGADVTVIAPKGTHSAPDAAKYRLRTFDVAGSGLPWSPLRGEVDALLRFTYDERPDVAIAEGWFTTGAALLPQIGHAARHTILSSHGTADRTLKALTPSQIFRALSYRWVEQSEQKRITAGLSAAILLTGYRDRDRFRDAALFERNNIPTVICPNPSTYQPRIVPRDGLRRHALLHVGSLSDGKNQILAIETLARLGPAYRLTLAFPEWTAYGDAAMNVADHLGVRDRIGFAQGLNRAALEQAFDDHDLLLITSRSEAQPIIASDALRKAMPFVSTPVGCMPEFKGGLVVHQRRLHQAIETVCEVMTDYIRYSREAITYYNAKLSHNRALQSLKSLFSKISVNE